MTTENADAPVGPASDAAAPGTPPPRSVNVHTLRQTAERRALVLIHGLLEEATALHEAGQIAFFPAERIALFNSLVAALPVIRPTRCV